MTGFVINLTGFVFLFFLLSQTVRNSGLIVNTESRRTYGFHFFFLFFNISGFFLRLCSSVYNILLVLFVLMVLKTRFPFNCVFKLNFLMHCFCMCFKNFFRWKYVITNTTFLMLVCDMFYE